MLPKKSHFFPPSGTCLTSCGRRSNRSRTTDPHQVRSAKREHRCSLWRIDQRAALDAISSSDYAPPRVGSGTTYPRRSSPTTRLCIAPSSSGSSLGCWTGSGRHHSPGECEELGGVDWEWQAVPPTAAPTAAPTARDGQGAVWGDLPHSRPQPHSLTEPRTA